MQFLGYILFRFFAYGVAITPRFIMLGFSYFIAFFFGSVMKYRRKVVAENIRNSFPEMDEKEVKKTVKGYYLHLADLIVEIIKSEALPFWIMKHRMKVENVELFGQLHNKGKGVIMLTGHFGNWELMNQLPKRGLNNKFQAVYMQPKNRSFDGFLRSLRGKFGCESIPMADLYGCLLEDKKAGRVVTTAMLADQSPHKQNIKYWKEFLNQETPCFVGPDTIARRLDLAVVYAHITKVKRNYYKYRFILLSDDVGSLKRNALVDLYMDALEANIKEQPSNWLWSHRRWKHKRADIEKK